MRILLLSSVAVLSWAGSSHAAFIDTALQTNDGVVFSGVGSFNTQGLMPNDFAATYFIAADVSYIASGFGTAFGSLTGPTDFGTGGLQRSTSHSGANLLLDVNGGEFGVPDGYLSGTLLTSTLTFAGATFDTLGVTPGTYVFNFNSGANADTFTLQIGPLPVAVPEPSTLALLSLGVAASAAVRRRRAM